MDTQTTPTETSFDATARQAAALYPEPVAKPIDVPPNAVIAALRASEGRGPAALYRDDMQMGNAPRELALAIDPALPADAIEGQASIVASICMDLGFNSDDVSRLASEAATYAKNKPSDVELAAHARTALQSLRETYYTDQAFDEALKGAKALATRDLRMKKFLAETGLGSSPWVVSRFAELSRTARNAQTLRK